MPVVRTLLIALALTAALDSNAQTGLRINEFMASNVGTITDPDFGDTADWIELYNPTSGAINLAGYTLTDDLSMPTRWRIPSGFTIPAGGYLIFWADDANTGAHTNFKLSSNGEEIGLFDPAGVSVDAIAYDVQHPDVSFGRLPNGQNTWRYLDKPTPGASNQGPGFAGIAPAPVFSQRGGFYNGSQSVGISAQGPSAVVRYTLDGAVPTNSSPAYSGPIPISKTTVVRAAVFQPDYVPGPVVTNTYFIGENVDLPVVSLSTDPANLWSNESGIYVEGTNGIEGFCAEGPRNWNQDWERPANFEFYETDRSPALNQVVGIKIFGGCSRIFDQKSLAVHARDRYGEGTLSHRFFLEKDIVSFESVVLRNSGQDWYRTMFRDAMVQTVVRQGINIDYQAYRPAVLFLNGQYWGIHNIREKMNEAYIEGNHGYPREEIDFLEGAAVPLRGSADHYNNLIDFVSSQDMSRDENLAIVDTWMDVDQYLDFQAAEIFIANADWPSGNIRFWRPRTETGRWRWMIFDTDLSFGGHSEGRYYSNTLAQATEPNGPAWPNPPWSTLLFRRLLENQDFRNQFVQRLAGHINTTFDSTRVLFVIDSLKANIASEVPRHKARWPESIGFNTPWDVHIDRMREFARLRAGQLYDHVVEHFGLTGVATFRLESNQAGRGRLYVAGVRARGDAYEGIYFRGVPLKVRAEPLPGYRFAGWSGLSSSMNNAIEIQLSANATLGALFEPEQDPTASEDEKMAYRFALEPNYPNPFTTATTVPYELAVPGTVSIRLFDITGREVRQIVDAYQPAGRHQLVIVRDGLATGVYLLELSTESATMRRTLSVVR